MQEAYGVTIVPPCRDVASKDRSKETDKGLEVAYNQIEAWARRTTSESTMRGPSKIKAGMLS